jgi:hypothetical protein
LATRRRYHLRQHRHDLAAEDGADRAGGVLIRSRRPQQADEAAVAQRPLPDLEEMGDQGPAYVRLCNDSEVRKLEIEGGGPRKQPLLAAEVADHHGRIDRRAGGDVADRRALIALVGKQVLRCLEDGRLRPLRFGGFGWTIGRWKLMPTSVDKYNHGDYVNNR